MAEDFHAILGVPPDASQTVIRHAFLELAKQCHPDLHPNDPDAAEKFKQIHRAFEKLYKPSRWQIRRVAFTMESVLVAIGKQSQRKRHDLRVRPLVARAITTGLILVAAIWVARDMGPSPAIQEPPKTVKSRRTIGDVIQEPPKTKNSRRAIDEAIQEPPKTEKSRRAIDEAIQEPPKKLLVDLGGWVKLEMVLIPAGEFLMGSPDSDKDARDDEKPQHHVRITKPFYLGTYHVTQRQFRWFVSETGYRTDAEKRENPARYDWNPHKNAFDFNEDYSWRNVGFELTEEHPVVCVSWNDAVAFCKWLSGKEGKTYRLPTEAEWEYACRAGTTTRYYSGDDPETLAKVGNVVGKFNPNAFGLYDMHGTTWQWCGGLVRRGILCRVAPRRSNRPKFQP